MCKQNNKKMFKIKTTISVFILIICLIWCFQTVNSNQNNCYEDCYNNYKNKIIRYSQDIPVYDYYFLLDNFQEMTSTLCQQTTNPNEFNQSYRSKLDQLVE